MQKLYWKGISHDDRIKAIGEITATIDKHGIILNFQRFSDIILSLVVEVEADKLNSLYDCLCKILILEGFDRNTPILPGCYTLFLNITFSKGTGDLEIEVPNIPE